jgi:hypothetical protein
VPGDGIMVMPEYCYSIPGAEVILALGYVSGEVAIACERVAGSPFRDV